MPDISKIQLPGNPGNVYDIKDAVARQMISGGISFIIVWTATDFASTTAPAAAKLATIPAGAEVAYNNGASTATGTLTASADTKAKFYLIYSKTQVGDIDNFNEYVTVENGSEYFWEKIGDTQIDLSNVVTGVSLSKQTDTVIGTDATFTITQPTITLAEDSSTGVTFVRGGTTKYMKATASGTAVTPSTTNLKATASGTVVGANGTAAAVTGYPNTTTDTFVKSVSADTTKKLVLTTVPNVTGNTSVTIPNVTSNTTVSASKISSNLSVKANKSTWTFTMGTGEGNTETLIIGGDNGSDVTATNTTYSNVTATNTVLGNDLTATNTTLGVAKTVATGSATTTGTGAAVVTDISIGDSASAITGLGTPSTATALTGVKVTTQPTVKLETGATAGTGVVSVATGISSVTQPNITLSNNGVSGTDLKYVESLDTSKKMKGTASGANTAWNSKDSVTVLKSTTDVNVTKGNQ